MTVNMNNTVAIIAPSGRCGNVFVQNYDHLTELGYKIVFVHSGNGKIDGPDYKNILNEKILSDNKKNNRNRKVLGDKMKFYPNVSEAYKDGIMYFIDTRIMSDGSTREKDVQSLVKLHENNSATIRYMDIGSRYNDSNIDMKNKFDNEEYLKNHNFLYHHTDRADIKFFDIFSDVINKHKFQKNKKHCIIMDYAQMGNVGTAAKLQNFLTSGNISRKINGTDPVSGTIFSYFDKNGETVSKESAAHVLGKTEKDNVTKYLIRTSDIENLKQLLELGKINYEINPKKFMEHLNSENNAAYPYIEVSIPSNNISISGGFDTKGEGFFTFTMVENMLNKVLGDQRVKKRNTEYNIQPSI